MTCGSFLDMSTVAFQPRVPRNYVHIADSAGTRAISIYRSKVRVWTLRWGMEVRMRLRFVPASDFSFSSKIGLMQKLNICSYITMQPNHVVFRIINHRGHGFLPTQFYAYILCICTHVTQTRRHSQTQYQHQQ